MNTLLLAIGLLLVLEGAPYFLFPRVVLRLIEQIGRMDPSTMRLAGGTMVGAGLLVVYWVRLHA